jgi:hypothetical protein
MGHGYDQFTFDAFYSNGTMHDMAVIRVKAR